MCLVLLTIKHLFLFCEYTFLRPVVTGKKASFPNIVLYTVQHSTVVVYVKGGSSNSSDVLIWKKSKRGKIVWYEIPVRLYNLLNHENKESELYIDR